MTIAQRLAEARLYLVRFNCVEKLYNCLLQSDAGKRFHCSYPTSVEYFHIKILIVNVFCGFDLVLSGMGACP